MGFLTSTKEKFNKAVGLGKNNDLFPGLFGVAGLAIQSAEKGKLKDTFLGKKADDIKPDTIADQIRSTQTRGIEELNAALDTPADDIVRQQGELAKRSVLSSAQDARRNAQKLMAQRGLAGTSIGLGLNRSIDQQTTKDMGAIDAAMPGQLRNQRLQDAQTRINVGGVNQNGMNFNTIEGQRSGGLLGYASAIAPFAGAAAGGYMGGPAGAQAGYQMGQGAGSAMNRQQNPNRGY